MIFDNTQSLLEALNAALGKRKGSAEQYTQATGEVEQPEKIEEKMTSAKPTTFGTTSK